MVVPPKIQVVKIKPWLAKFKGIRHILVSLVCGCYLASHTVLLKWEDASHDYQNVNVKCNLFIPTENQ